MNRVKGPPSAVRCTACVGRGCTSCEGWGWRWSDGVTPQRCTQMNGAACGRVSQCGPCPHVGVMWTPIVTKAPC